MNTKSPVPVKRTSKVDAVIVGSGPAGAAAADALVRAGREIVMLDAGARPVQDRYALMDESVRLEIPWKFPHYPYEMVGDDVELNLFAIRKVGGSSLAWGAIAPRFHAADFELHTRYGVGVDWPLSYEELEPYYCKAEAFMGVSGADDNPYASPRSQPYPMGPFAMNDTDQLVKAAGEKLDIKFHSVPCARNSVIYQNRSACAYYGVCRACPISAMFSSDYVVNRLETKPNFLLRPDSQAIRVETDSNGKADAVVYVDSTGKEQIVRGSRIILATQTVETVRLLLNSGLCNGNGMLGKYFMEHPKFYLSGRVNQRLNPYRQGFETATTLKFHDHPRRDQYAGGRLLVRENAGPSVPEIAVESGLWGEELRREIKETFGHFITLGAFLEQLPYEHNRISLSDCERDSAGMPAAKVEFKIQGDYEDEGYRQMSNVMRELFDELGAMDVDVIMPPSNSGHYMGGHRMGTDSDASTTNSFLQTHEIDNLYLAGGGVFPTAGVSNPTLTTVALTLRMADHILVS